MYFIILVYVDCSADTYIFDDGNDAKSACNSYCTRLLNINRYYYYFSTKTWNIIGEYDGISVAVVVIVVVLVLLGT